MSEAEENRKGWREKFLDLFSGEPADQIQLKEMLQDAADRALLDQEALNIIYGAMQVSEMHARDIMVPRSSVVYIEADKRPEEFLPTVIEARHSRFPVVGDDLDDIKGILHAKDFLPLLLKDSWDDFALKDCIRPATMVPESKRLNVLLQEFRATRNHMAVVIDEYGHVAGVVTIEDVLEQIVGEIEDEHDVDDDSFIKQLDGSSYTVKAATTIEDFNEYFSAEFGDDEFDTIGGLVLKEFGHLPQRGETVELGGFGFRVLNADSRRIRLLRVTCR